MQIMIKLFLYSTRYRKNSSITKNDTNIYLSNPLNKSQPPFTLTVVPMKREFKSTALPRLQIFQQKILKRVTNAILFFFFCSQCPGSIQALYVGYNFWHARSLPLWPGGNVAKIFSNCVWRRCISGIETFCWYFWALLCVSIHLFTHSDYHHCS